MRRRRFLSSLLATTAGGFAQNKDSKLLLPTDKPDELGLRLMWHHPTPPVDRNTYRLQIKGLVEKERSFALDEMRKFPQETQGSRLKCVQCWSARTTWGGFRFGNLVESAKPLKTAKAVRFDCADTWYEYFSMEDLMSPRLLAAIDLLGKPLPDGHGAPLRLIDPSRYGYKSAKQIVAITFVADGKGSMACDVFPYYSPSGEIQAGYDHPLDIGPTARRRIKGGEITDY